MNTESNKNDIWEELENQLKQFESFLMPKFKKRTVHRHVVVISNLIDFLCFDCCVTRYQEIRRGMVYSRFCRWYCSNMADLTESQLRASLKKFFSFLVLEQGVKIDQDLLAALKIKGEAGKSFNILNSSELR